jgi:hypothetical protein
MNHVRTAAASMALCLALGTSLTSQSATAPRTNAAGNGRFTFALIGDMPYGAEGDLKFPNVIADINADRTLSFVAHDGDIKNGSSVCSDAMFFNRLELFNRFVHPVIYVPGDNEWTDCHRANNGAYDPLERLAFLRALFFPTDESLGQHTLVLERQSSDPSYALYRENVRWTVKNVLFAGLHVVGSNNNLGRTPESTAEYVARNAATLDWLRSTFTRAREEAHQAVMLIVQANPGFELPAPQRTGFNDFLATLEAETIAYGQPVVLVHGDSHYFRIDKPLIGTRSRRRVENFTRVETFGENDNHWLHVTVEPNSPNVFVFDQRLVAANVVH